MLLIDNNCISIIIIMLKKLTLKLKTTTMQSIIRDFSTWLMSRQDQKYANNKLLVSNSKFFSVESLTRYYTLQKSCSTINLEEQSVVQIAKGKFTLPPGTHSQKAVMESKYLLKCWIYFDSYSMYSYWLIILVLTILELFWNYVELYLRISFCQIR